MQLQLPLTIWSFEVWTLRSSHGPATGSSTELIIQLQSASSPHPSAEPGWDPLRAALKTERGGHLSQSAFLRCTCMDVQVFTWFHVFVVYF